MAKKTAKAERAKRASKPRAAPKKPAKRRAKLAAPSLDAVARKIVRATQRADFPFVELYTADCTSAEPRGEPARGHSGIDAKDQRWKEMQRSAKWHARNVWTGKNTVCIEWDGEVELRDGRFVRLREIAVHEIKGGKIQHERFYYDPAALAPAAS